MEERNYSINWLSLFIKVTVFVVVVLLAIWLVAKITRKEKGLSFEENNLKFQDASIEYFRKNLPEENEKITVTLKQLINWDYTQELKNEKGKSCDKKNSKSQIELAEDYYSIKSELICGSESQTSYLKLGNEECTNCDVKIEGLTINETKKQEETKENETINEETNGGSKGTISSNNQTTQGSNTTETNNNSNANETILYEYVKEINEYSDWYVGKVTGSNIENSTKTISYSEYCKNEELTYYTVSYITTKKKYKYTLELKNISTKNKITLEDTNYFSTTSDYKNYIDTRDENLSMVNSNKNATINIPNSSTLKTYSLKSDNFTFDISKPYKSNGKYYVDIEVNIKNLNDVSSYYASNIGQKVYFVPIKFVVTYTDINNCITDKTLNSDNYSNYTVVDTWNQTVDVYRYKKTISEYKYSNKASLEGYTKTGNTKIAS